MVDIERAINHAAQAEVRQRAIAIRLLHLGHAPEAAAEMLAVAPSTIWNWHRRYRAEGINGLTNRAKSGRPAKADDHYLAEVERALDTDARELGYAFSVWTINKLRKHLEKQTGILLSYTRFRALLSKQEYVYRQPKHDLSDLQDADAKAAAEDFLEWLKKSPSQTMPSSSSLWMKRA
ncbi:MAG: helix-turn-helix domain-containing protein [Anaerolineae bacterium]|nr:helix-turn-helix domain-containing protein [Anaerolineae bacterium]